MSAEPSRDESSSKRRRGIFAAAALLGLLGLFLARGGAPPVVQPTPTTTTSVASAPASTMGPNGVPKPPKPMGAAPNGSALSEGATPAEVHAFRKHRVESLKELGKFPGYSRPLTDRHYEALTLVEPQVAHGGGKESESERNDAFIVQPSKLQYQDGEIPVIFAEVMNTESGKRQSASITATLVKLIADDPAQAGPLGTLPFNDDGKDGDLAAGDLRYTASVHPGMVPPAKLRGMVHIEMHARLADGRERKTLTAFRVGTPGARLTGKFADFIEEGHLVVQAMVHVDKPGRYHLQGGLVGPGGEKIAWSQSATVVDAAGEVPLRMKFFGLAFVQANVPGPYTLKFVSVAETLTRPAVQGPVLEDAYVTKPYVLSVFSAEPNKDPGLADTIKQAESLVNEPVSIVPGGPPVPKNKPAPPP